MKALVLRAQAPIESRPLVLGEVARPEPAAAELLVRVLACGICRTDLHVVEGDLPLVRAPVIPGHQVVGEVVEIGADVRSFRPGDRVGIAWLRRTCGTCGFCRSGRENLCAAAELTGWTADGGFAELAVVPAAFAYRLPIGMAPAAAAPLLCAGIIGYRALRFAGMPAGTAAGTAPGGWSGARLGIYGFGAAGHVAIQIARARGAEVFVFTRDRGRHQALAAELGAEWVGSSTDEPPAKLDAAVIFAPAGELVPVALQALERGGVLVLGGIHISPIPSFDYGLIYGERSIRSVMNNVRADGEELLAEAERIPVRTHVERFPLEAGNDALIALKRDGIRGAGVLDVAPGSPSRADTAAAD